MFNIEEELKKLPALPGVYLMHDKHDNIIYVGKAISLRNRVRQYFRKSTKKSTKIERMVENIHHFEYIVTDSELEALILECNLIKKYRPKYNTMLKDDKSYPFIRVTIEEDFPRVLFARCMKKDKSKYFGPFTSSGAVKDTIELAAGLFKVRTCNKKIFENVNNGIVFDDGSNMTGNIEKNVNKRACLNYHIDRCPGPCIGKISKVEYEKNVERLLSFLSGNQEEVKKELEEKMIKASAEMKFEEAAKYRDLLKSIEHISGHQKITSHSFDDRDVIATCIAEGEAVVQAFFIRGGKLIGREHFFVKLAQDKKKEEETVLTKEVITNFIKQYYGGTPYIPRVINVECEIEDKDIIESYLQSLSGFKVSIVEPKKGDKEKMLELAKKNAQMVMLKDHEKLIREKERTTKAVENISAKLKIPYAKRIEAYDISNTNGYDSVGSMIVYEDGKPKRNAYRRFKIKWVKGANDYKSLDEVLTRRLEHGLREREELIKKGVNPDEGSFSRFPDLIMMDGGLGQVNIALEVMRKLNLNIPVSGMVKDDHHNTRGLIYAGEEIPLERNSEEFKLITRVQDEAHRFAIEFHRSLRSKRQVKSVLDDIEGIGPKRRKALMKAFGDIKGIENANLTELENTEGMNKLSAKRVYEFFH